MSTFDINYDIVIKTGEYWICLKEVFLMKAFEFPGWASSPSNKGLLFFAQAMEEMLFHYGHDSLKVPALNFRFLCIEIQKTIKKINADIVDKGNMRPLLAELKDAFKKDSIAQRLFGNNFECLFFSKNADGEIHQDCSDIFKDPCSEASLKRINQVINYLLNEMQLNDQYYAMLKDTITETAKINPFLLEQQDILYHLSRLLLTDLINYSYSQEYIYWVVNEIFYNRDRTDLEVDSALELFWSYFDFAEKEYIVTLPLKSAALQKHLINFQNVTIKENENRLFRNSCKWIIEVEITGMDIYQAQANALQLVSFFVSLLQYNNHKSQSYSTELTIISLKGSDESLTLRAPTTPLKRGTVLSDEKNNEKVALMVKNFAFSPAKLVNVIELHSSAINSSDIHNQLLNLWTIIEVLIPTEPKHSFAKINQLCNVITSVLNAQYISSLITQLLLDLEHCIPRVLHSELSKVIEGQNEEEKIAAILVMDKYQAEKESLINTLNFYPLLQYRIEQYSEVLSNRLSLKEYLVAHRKRVFWHIMRIYRNRNMIVHDGSHFPYIDVIVQNLHHYVDSLIDTINIYAGKGYTSIKTIYTALQQKEYRYLRSLEKKEQNGSPKKVDDDFVAVIFGYIN